MAFESMGKIGVALPLTLMFISPLIKHKAGPSPFALGVTLGIFGIILALGVFGWVSVRSYRATEDLYDRSPEDPDDLLELVGSGAVALYILVWLGILAWLVR